MTDEREDVAPPEEVAGLAEERTALAWTRTGLSFVVAGVVLLRLLRGTGPAETTLAAAFVVLGSVAWLWGWHAPEAQPAWGCALGRSAMRALALGTAAVAVGSGLVVLG